MATADSALLKVEDLSTWFGAPEQPLRAVDGVCFEIETGQTVALVGESGCGKSVTAMSLTRLIPSPPARYAGGRVLLDGRDLLRMEERALTEVRGAEVAYVFQEPGTALNPVMRIGDQVREALRRHHQGASASEAAVGLLRRVGLPDPERRMRAYPHELSGGMQQRAMIAMALACRPKLLVADEPTTALDVTIQAQILELLKSLQSELGMAVLLITHNLGLVADVAHRVHVMYAGQIVESGPTEPVLRSPRHPYTRGLLNAVPTLRARRGRLTGIPGTVPHPGEYPAGCRFAPRCERAQARCRADAPALQESGGRCSRCWCPLE